MSPERKFRRLASSFFYSCLLLMASHFGVEPLFIGPAQAQSELQVAAEASNQFALDLHKLLAKEKGNLFYSPASISAALGMTFAGSENETRQQMMNVLHIPQNSKPWMQANERITSLFNQKLDGFEVRLANRLWGQKDFAFQPSFLELSERVWQAPLGTVDFVSQPEPSRELINEWVAAQTNDRIRDLLPQGVIDRSTRLVLTNAIYFKADWMSEFNRESTQEAPFARSEGDSVNVPLMFQKDRFEFYENAQLQRLSLPYKAGETLMEIILPRDPKSLIEIEQSLSLEQFAEWNESARQMEVEVYLPRFKTSASFQMKTLLSQLGMERAFSDEAEFGGISSQEELKISEVVHKAFVEVDEKGTEAAAATGVIMTTKMARPQDPIVFRADHPFLILIRHQPSGLILFMGRVADPKPN